MLIIINNSHHDVIKIELTYQFLNSMKNKRKFMCNSVDYVSYLQLFVFALKFFFFK